MTSFIRDVEGIKDNEGNKDESPSQDKREEEENPPSPSDQHEYYKLDNNI